MTLRWNTERPITIDMGTNALIGPDPDAIRRSAAAAIDGPRPSAKRPPLWDGKAGERIAAEIVRWHAARP